MSGGQPCLVRYSTARRVASIGQRLQRFLQGRFGVVTMTVEKVHVVQLHALQALVEAGHEALARPPVAVRSGPHFVSRFRADEKLVAVGCEVKLQQACQSPLRTARRRPVVVGQVEVRDAVVEGVTGNGAAVVKVIAFAEVVPKAEADFGQHHSAASRTGIQHPAFVAVGGSFVSIHFAPEKRLAEGISEELDLYGRRDALI